MDDYKRIMVVSNLPQERAAAREQLMEHDVHIVSNNFLAIDALIQKEYDVVLIGQVQSPDFDIRRTEAGQINLERRDQNLCFSLADIAVVKSVPRIAIVLADRLDQVVESVNFFTSTWKESSPGNLNDLGRRIIQIDVGGGSKLFLFDNCKIRVDEYNYAREVLANESDDREPTGFIEVTAWNQVLQRLLVL